MRSCRDGVVPTQAQAKLKAVMDKLERLEKEFNEANDKKLQLQRDVEECAARLERAKKLNGGLGGERTRWTESCASLELSYAKLVGDALISAATIAYTGAFTPTFRKSMTDHWQTRRARGVPLYSCPSSACPTLLEC